MLSLFLVLAAQTVDHSGHAAPATAKPSKAERQVCRSYQDTSSRMGAKKVCRTAAEWQAMEARGERETVDIRRSGRSY